MAQFDLMTVRNTGELVVDCQSDLLRHLPTRFVIPFFELGMDLEPSGRLNPVFEVAGRNMLLGTQYAVSIPMAELARADGSLEQHAYEITGALDMLIGGV
jgi:toxin CcdB